MDLPRLTDTGPAHLSRVTADDVRRALLEGREIALLDVREEVPHAEGHPLFAANLPLSRLELEAYARLPYENVPIVVFDDGEGYAETAAERLRDLGYGNLSLLEGGLSGWREAGLEVFRDVNSPSKAFGELVESRSHTPSLSAQEVQKLIEDGADVVITDARRYEEFQTMSIPTAVSVPGGELVLRLQSFTRRPSTQLIVNCAGRTRGILGAQSLRNAGYPNQVAALRNGTIGWKLARQSLNHGATSVLPLPDPQSREQAAKAARRVADAAGVRRISLDPLSRWKHERTVYLFDVRSPEEYAAGHLRSFRSAPGGQLVQETDRFAPVRGAAIALADNDGARANMTASWLAQMNWEVYVVDGLSAEDFNQQDEETRLPLPPHVPPSCRIRPETLDQWLQSSSRDGSPPIVLDFSPSPDYLRGHIPGAQFGLRSRILEALESTRGGARYVVTANEELTRCLAWKELSALADVPVYLLEGGTPTWRSAGYSIEDSDAAFASQPVDRYQRPYEGTDSSVEAMHAYLDWEAGLVAQLERDNTHGFWVLV